MQKQIPKLCLVLSYPRKQISFLWNPVNKKGEQVKTNKVSKRTCLKLEPELLVPLHFILAVKMQMVLFSHR